MEYNLGLCLAIQSLI